MEKLLRIANGFEEADEIASLDDDQLSIEQRLEAFMQMMRPYFEAAGGLQRVYRVDDRRERKIRDDWGPCVQRVPKPANDR